MVVVGLLTGIGLWALGMPSALTLGLMAGVLEFIPFAGPILSAVPAVLLALAVSPDLALWVLLLYFAVQQFEGYVLTPLVQQYAVDLPGVVLLFSLLAFGALFGTLGVILAAPLTVVTYVLIKRLYVIETLHTPTPIPGEKDRLDLQQSVGPLELLADHELGDVVDRRSAHGLALVRAVVGVAVDDRFHMVETVDRVCQAG